MVWTLFGLSPGRRSVLVYRKTYALFIVILIIYYNSYKESKTCELGEVFSKLDFNNSIWLKNVQNFFLCFMSRKLFEERFLIDLERFRLWKVIFESFFLRNIIRYIKLTGNDNISDSCDIQLLQLKYFQKLLKKTKMILEVKTKLNGNKEFWRFKKLYWKKKENLDFNF